MIDLTDLASLLEYLLVQEFRAYQSLYSLTKKERSALAASDIKSLAMVIEQKETVLNELGQLDSHRRTLVQEMATRLGIKTPMPTLTEISAAIEGKLGARLHRIMEGIAALTTNTHHLERGNQALALAAIDQADIIRSYILDIYRPALPHQPHDVLSTVDGRPVWCVDQRK